MFTDSKARQSWVRIIASLIAVVIVWSAGTPDVQAGERKFIVMLAHSPKQFGGNLPPGGLVDRAVIDNAYFKLDPNDGVDTFVEYWEEVSYGDVTAAGITTDWINLPWAIQGTAGNTPSDFTFLRTGVSILTPFFYGVSETFANSQSMIITDIDGDPNTVDNGPFPGAFGPGGSDTGKRSGVAVYMPGQRFLDMDGDGRWDGLDEANNQMDHDRNSIPDLGGAWIDIDGNGQPNNAVGCIFHDDSDNDQRPDCCPDGPGLLSCGGLREEEIPTATSTVLITACPPTTSMVTVRGQMVTVNDCNGNGIPDACDVLSMTTGLACAGSPECVATGWLDDLDFFDVPINPCGVRPGTTDSILSPDLLPRVTVANSCTGVPDGIPDECQFENWDMSLNISNQSALCTSEMPNMSGMPSPGCPDDNLDMCIVRLQSGPATPMRCEYDDSNGDNILDVVEPYESFLRIGHHLAVGPTGDPDPGIELDVNTSFGREYITNNYPGNADKIIDQSLTRKLWAVHDPMGNTVSCVCKDGRPCRTLGRCIGTFLLCETSSDCAPGRSCDNSTVVSGMCPAGEHISYTSPDRWFESGITTKMVNVNFNGIGKGTAEPSWYKDAWKDRYPSSIHGSCMSSCTPNCQPDECVPVWDAVRAANPTSFGSPSQRIDVPNMTEFQGNQRRYFDANRGGLKGGGIGWTGMGNQDVDFSTRFFEANFGAVTIMPEEMNGLNTPLVLFDSLVEHDDLPSSKYHQGGDQRLGEVTSPSNNDIWGQDLSPANGVDGFIAAAGPYAGAGNGNLNTDAGNVLSMELLTWRWEEPFNDAQAWEGQAGRLYVRPSPDHPYAGQLGEGLGFRDFNLDGLLDQGEVRPVGSENYLVDSFIERARIPGTQTAYPFNRQRLMEECVESLDSIIDFDLFVDSNALDAAGCANAVWPAFAPAQYGSHFVSPAGAVSGIVLLPNGSHNPGDFLLAPLFYSIHNDDSSNSSTVVSPELNWNLAFHDLVIELAPGGAANDQQVAYSAHEYLHSWEGYPDLYDYDIFLPTNAGAQINAPAGGWDIMAVSGITTQGYVHPSPILKESPCSQWIEPVDLSTILTPGVDQRITLPPSEFVRDESHFFLENEDILGERYYFWSVGSGLNRNMPGPGMLIQHTDVGGNPEALPSGQQSATRFQFLIVQADGLRQLEDGVTPNGDAGDPFPGTTNNTSFTCDTTPPSQWYNFNTCNGLSVTDIQVDGNGSASGVFNLVPTSIPSLRFLQPTGGETNNNGVYSIRTRVADSFGGTTVRLYYTTDKNDVSIGSNLIGLFKTTTPGTNEFDVDWDINGLSDGQYFVFAELAPGVGADNRTEKTNTAPRNGRNNKGDGSLVVDDVNIAGNVARFETWVVRATNAAGTDWVVNSSLSQPDIGLCVGGSDSGEACDVDADCASSNCDTDRFAHATTGVQYTSVNGEVMFTINEGAIPFTIDDTVAFSTTGITAASAPVTILGGAISEDPIAVIVAAPLSGTSPLTVEFDGRQSTDPRASQALGFEWDFGDGSPTVSGTAVTTHTYSGAQTFTAILTVTNSQTTRSGEASVDIVLTNNSPNAQMSVTPLSGPSPLTVAFNSAGSSDNESATSDLVFEWDFGDGQTAGTGVPGEFNSVNHIYFDEGDFTASLTVTDPGGKRDTVTLDLLVGNTRPVAAITTSLLLGTDPLRVSFDATRSTDADGDALTVVWTFDVNNPSDTITQDLSAIASDADGSVEHTYRTATGQSSASFTATAVIMDARGASVKTSFNIVVNEAPFGADQPRARFSIAPNPPLQGVAFTGDASASFDSPDPDVALAAYDWNWGDNSTSSGMLVSHTFVNSGRYAITLSVTDADGNVNSNTQIVAVAAGRGGDSDNRDPVAIIGTGPRSGSVPLTIEFNGLNSFDLDGDPLEFTWQIHFENTLVNTLAGPIVTETFETAGVYTVTLLVSDGQGGLGISEARVVEVDPRVGAPGQADPGAGQATPGDTTGTTPGICGLGMVTSMFGSLVGLLGMMVSRRRSFWS